VTSSGKRGKRWKENNLIQCVYERKQNKEDFEEGCLLG
jgi:hypothetical protein